MTQYLTIPHDATEEPTMASMQEKAARGGAERCSSAPQSRIDVRGLQ